jgi:hypothetical protein
MEWDRFDAYAKAVDEILRAESGKPSRRKPNLPESQRTVAEQADKLLREIVASKG